MKPVLCDARIVSNRPVNNSVFMMRLHVKAFAEAIIPGQFIMVQTSENGFPLFRRPFSVCGIVRDGIEILYHRRGAGTKQMSLFRAGDIISIIAPLGSGFVFSESIRKVYIIAGGIGIAPLLFLMKKLNKSGIKLEVFVGAENYDKLLNPEKFGINDMPVHFATDDGSVGFKGVVSELFNDFMQTKQNLSDIEKTCICSCGPLPMLKKIANLAEKFNIRCYVSVESRMACGVGACLGCAVSVKEAGREDLYKRTCFDGPVFDIKNINMDKITF